VAENDVNGDEEDEEFKIWQLNRGWVDVWED